MADDDKKCPKCGNGKSPKYPTCLACKDAVATSPSSDTNAPDVGCDKTKKVHHRIGVGGRD